MIPMGYQYLVIAIVGAGIGVAGAVVYKNGEIAVLELAHQKVINEHTEKIAQQERDRADQSELYRLREQTWTRIVATIVKEREDEKVEHAKTVTTLRATNSGLRNKIAALNSRPAADDTLTACRARATAFGNVFGSCSEALVGMGADAERHSGEVRVLKRYSETLQEQGVPKPITEGK